MKDGKMWEGVKDVFSSPLDLLLLGIIGFVLVRIVLRRMRKDEGPAPEPRLPPLPKQDMTLEQLSAFDGSAEDGRILMAVDGKIFDVTIAKRLYGKDGPYGLFAGRDASRGLATFTINQEAVRDSFDDLSDLSSSEIDSMKEWATQFSEKYPVVGKLLKPGEEPTVYEEQDDAEDKKTQ